MEKNIPFLLPIQATPAHTPFPHDRSEAKRSLKIRYLSPIAIFCIAVLLLTGCGSNGKAGGDATTSTAPPPAAQASIVNGMASKGPISGATVNVYGIKDGIIDLSAAIGSGQTVDGGSYSVNIGSHEGPVVVEVTGGTFTDEASGTTVALKIPLHAIVADAKINETTTVAVTPMTELAYKKAKGGGPLTGESINSANESVALSFGLRNIVSVLPVPGGETDDQKKYAAACGAFSLLVTFNKQEKEPLDDALERILGKFDDEEEHDGELSTDSTTMINGAITSFNNNMIATGTTATTGTANATVPAFASGALKLATVGIPFALSGLDLTLALPLGITVDFDPTTGITADGVVTLSGVADFGNNNFIVAKYTPAFFGTPALLHIVMRNMNGFSLGEFATIQFNVFPNGIFPTQDEFIPVNLYVRGFTGLGLQGVAVVPLSVEML
jgi:hypothetical protein